jgi:hypothetical protein
MYPHVYIIIFEKINHEHGDIQRKQIEHCTDRIW